MSFRRSLSKWQGFNNENRIMHVPCQQGENMDEKQLAMLIEAIRAGDEAKVDAINRLVDTIAEGMAAQSAGMEVHANALDVMATALRDIQENGLD
jgi:predicted transcriptional regulator